MKLAILSHWYPVSGVVIDCIDSWSLHPYLLWLSELFCLCCMAVLKNIPALSFNALIFPILRIVCTISFHHSCPWISSILFHWYPGSGVVLNCIDSWSLHPYLLWLSELLCLYCVAALKSLPALSFNALIFPILRIVCTIPFHYSCPLISSILSHWYPGSGVVLDWIDSWSLHPNLLWLSELFCLCCVAALKSLPALSFNALIFPILGIGCKSPSIIPVPGYPLYFPIGILGQLWYLIVSIPDLCTLNYFYMVFYTVGSLQWSSSTNTSNLVVKWPKIIHNKTKTQNSTKQREADQTTFFLLSFFQATDQQQQNHRPRTNSSSIHQGKGLNAFYLDQIFAFGL